VRGQVLDLLLELQEEMGLAYLFISHDMAVIERMSHDVAVMRGGAFLEYGGRRQVFENPTQVYTKALMKAVPVPIPRPERAADRDTYNENTNDFSWHNTNIQ
jgi:peptide/nickel transport system ATP-binding protein